MNVARGVLLFILVLVAVFVPLPVGAQDSVDEPGTVCPPIFSSETYSLWPVWARVFIPLLSLASCSGPAIEIQVPNPEVGVLKRDYYADWERGVRFGSDMVVSVADPYSIQRLSIVYQFNRAVQSRYPVILCSENMPYPYSQVCQTVSNSSDNDVSTDGVSYFAQQIMSWRLEKAWSDWSTDASSSGLLLSLPCDHVVSDLIDGNRITGRVVGPYCKSYMSFTVIGMAYRFNVNGLLVSFVGVDGNNSSADSLMFVNQMRIWPGGPYNFIEIMGTHNLQRVGETNWQTIWDEIRSDASRIVHTDMESMAWEHIPVEDVQRVVGVTGVTAVGSAIGWYVIRFGQILSAPASLLILPSPNCLFDLDFDGQNDCVHVINS